MIADATIGAALIAATITFIGLIISKENKTSDFRQAWIEDVREQVAKILADANAIADLSQRPYDTPKEKLDYLSPFYRNLNENLFSITLRLNNQ